MIHFDKFQASLAFNICPNDMTRAILIFAPFFGLFYYTASIKIPEIALK